MARFGVRIPGLVARTPIVHKRPIAARGQQSDRGPGGWRARARGTGRSRSRGGDRFGTGRSTCGAWLSDWQCGAARCVAGIAISGRRFSTSARFRSRASGIARAAGRAWRSRVGAGDRARARGSGRVAGDGAGAGARAGIPLRRRTSSWRRRGSLAAVSSCHDCRMRGGRLVACVLALPVVGCAMDDSEVRACARRRSAPVISSDEPLTVDVSGDGCQDAVVTCVSRALEDGLAPDFNSVRSAPPRASSWRRA